VSLADLKGVGLAEVWKAGSHAASLRRDGGDVVFEYLPTYLGPPIAFTLPRDVGQQRRAAGALPPFFTGLLPEGRRLSAIQRAAKTSADDELTLLLAVGADTVGDVQIFAAGVQPDLDGAVVQNAPKLEDADFREVFERAITPSSLDRAALAGVQDKVSGGVISLPVSHSGAAWILKLDPPEYPGVVENEAFFLAAARDSGLEVAGAEIVRDRNGVPGLLVRRFDRSVTPSGRLAFAQEDACQVLGRYPADKYRVTTEEVISGLAACTGAPVVAARTMLQQFAFAYLTCNGDAHAKNFSVLRRGEWRIAPAYDLVCTQVYGDHTLALSLGGKTREDVGRKDFLELGARVGVPAKATARVLDELLAAVPGWLGRLDELPFDEGRIHRLHKACAYRVRRLAP
jgi:serine/threonine-protein kinase HipA